MKKKVYILLIFIISWTVVHIHPSTSLKFKVLIHGFPREAIYSNMIHVKNINHKRYYQLEPTPIDKNVGAMNLWEVHKVGPFYFSNYYGSF